MEVEYSYEEIVEIIQNKRRFGNLTGYEISKIVLEKLGNPQNGLPIIHIAGTNGKGSVSAFLCNILMESGLKTGMFTSPHLVEFGERIRVNGEMISKEDTKRLGSLLLDMDFGVHPTMFDYCLAMALLYFKEQQCDVIILETGLGGKYDSTNAVGVPVVSVITKIGYDHMAILGNTLPEIAAEKAGIIKKDTHVICESQDEEIENIFKETAEKAGAASMKVIDWSELKIEPMTEQGEQCFSAYGYEHLTMKMLGLHQYENAAAAILAGETFLENWNDIVGVKPEQDMEGIVSNRFGKEEIASAVRKGIAKTVWKGRMEILSKEPFFLIDGAHNAHGVTALYKSLVSLYPEEKFHFIMGVMADKDYEDMIEVLLPLAIDFTTVTVGYSRSLEAEKLAECIASKGVKAESKETLEEALLDLTKERKEKTIAFGSLYFIGEIEEKNGI